MKNILSVIIIFFPWSIKKFIYSRIFGYEFGTNSHIGFSFVACRHLQMGKNSKIGHFNFLIHLDVVKLGDYSSIGRLNWITGFSTYSQKTLHFLHQKDNREAKLLIGNHSAITKNHHLDCTNAIKIGNYTTVAGYSSQFLTHSIDILMNRQDSYPIVIGDYCFVGTNCVLLGGAILPSYSVLGAKALLNKEMFEEFSLYGGNPAKFIKSLDKNSLYFHRKKGFVN